MRKLLVVIPIVLLIITFVWFYSQRPAQRPFLEAYGVRALSLFPDGKVVVVSTFRGTGEGFLTVYSANGTPLWNLTPCNCSTLYSTYWDNVLYARVSPNGKYLGVVTINKFILYRENGTLLWEKKNPLSRNLWSDGSQWASVQFTNDSRYVAFGVTASKSVFQVFSTNGKLLLNGTAQGITGMKVSDDGVYLMEDFLFSKGIMGSKLIYYGFNGSNWSIEFPSGSPRAIDVLKTANGTYVAYADCMLGITLIKGGKVLWNRDNGTCYWDVAFWRGRIYVATPMRLVDVYSLDGRLLSTIRTPEFGGIPTLLPAPRKILLLQKILLPSDSRKWVVDVLTINSTGDIIKVKSLEGFPASDFLSHITADYRRGRLILGVIKEPGRYEKYEIYLIPVN